MEFLRIRFITPKHYSFHLEKNAQLTLKLDQVSLYFSISTTESNIYKIYTLKSNDFDFKISDETVQKIVDSLYLLCLEQDIGILTNPNLSTSWANLPLIKEFVSKPDLKIENEFIGVKVIPTGTKFIGSNPINLESRLNINRFEELLNKYTGLNYQKSEKLIRAIEIYNSSNYLTFVNQSGRFILQMSAVEALIDQFKVSKRLQNSLDSYIKRINRLKIENEERDSVVGSLNTLKNISIKRSGKILVEYLFDNSKRYNQFPPSTFFSKAYDLRSKFVHDGETKTKDLDIKTIQMQEFVKEMLQNYFLKICCKSNNWSLKKI